MRFYFLLAITGFNSAIYLPQMERLNLQSVSKMGKYKFGKGRRLQKHISVSPLLVKSEVDAPQSGRCRKWTVRTIETFFKNWMALDEDPNEYQYDF